MTSGQLIQLVLYLITRQVDLSVVLPPCPPVFSLLTLLPHKIRLNMTGSERSGEGGGGGEE